MDRNLLILGIAKKAGLLAVGSEDTGSAARAGKARLVVSAHDASTAALRRAHKNAEIGQSLHVVVPYTSFELGSIIGRGSPGTLAILDIGLATRFVVGLAKNEPVRYGESAESLKRMALAQNIKKRRALFAKRRTVQ